MLFNNLDQLYRSVIMDHYKNPRNHGSLEGEHCVTVHMNNPSCGDKIQVSLKIKDDKIVDAKFSGSGCAISQASASMMTTAVKGLSVDQAHQLVFDFSEMVQGHPHDDELDLGDAEALHGVSQYPARIKCATLAWKAADKALREADSEQEQSRSAEE